MAKIQRLHERELWAERQAQAVAEHSAQRRELNEDVRVHVAKPTAAEGSGAGGDA